MLWVNHRRCLVNLGATTPEFYREVTLELRRFLQALARQAKGASQTHARVPKTTPEPKTTFNPKPNGAMETAI
jgi:hypothetical protein